MPSEPPWWWARELPTARSSQGRFSCSRSSSVHAFVSSVEINSFLFIVVLISSPGPCTHRLSPFLSNPSEVTIFRSGLPLIPKLAVWLHVGFTCSLFSFMDVFALRFQTVSISSSNPRSVRRQLQNPHVYPSSFPYRTPPKSPYSTFPCPRRSQVCPFPNHQSITPSALFASAASAVCCLASGERKQKGKQVGRAPPPLRERQHDAHSFVANRHGFGGAH